MEYISNNFISSVVARKEAELADARNRILAEAVPTQAPQPQVIEGLGGLSQLGVDNVVTQPVQPVQVPTAPMGILDSMHAPQTGNTLTSEQMMALATENSGGSSSGGLGRLGNFVDLAQQSAGRISADLVSTVPDIISGVASRAQSLYTGQDLTQIQQGYKAEADKRGMGSLFDKNFNFTGLDEYSKAPTWGADESRITEAHADLGRAFDSGNPMEMAQSLARTIVNAGPEVVMQSAADMYLLAKSGVKKGVGVGTGMLVNYINNTGNEREAITGKAQTPEELGMTALSGAGQFIMDKLGVDAVLGNTKLLKGVTDAVFSGSSSTVASGVVKTLAKKASELSLRGASEGVTEALQGVMADYGAKYGTEKANELAADPMIKKAFTDFGLGLGGGIAGSVGADVVSSPMAGVNAVTGAIDAIGEKAKVATETLKQKAYSDEDRQNLANKYETESLVMDSQIADFRDKQSKVNNTTDIEELKAMNDPIINEAINTAKDPHNIDFATLKKQVSDAYESTIKETETAFKAARVKDTAYTVMNNLKAATKEAVVDVSDKAKEVGNAVAQKLGIDSMPDLTTALTVAKAVGTYSTNDMTVEDIKNSYEVIKATATEMSRDTGIKVSEIRDLLATTTKTELENMQLDPANKDNVRLQKAIDFTLTKMNKVKETKEKANVNKEVLKNIPIDSTVNSFDKLLEDTEAGITKFKGKGDALLIDIRNLLGMKIITDDKAKADTIKNKISRALDAVEKSDWYNAVNEDGSVNKAKAFVDSTKKMYEETMGEAPKVVAKAKVNTETVTTTDEIKTKVEPEFIIDEKAKAIYDGISNVITNSEAGKTNDPATNDASTLGQLTRFVDMLEDPKQATGTKAMIKNQLLKQPDMSDSDLEQYITVIKNTSLDKLQKAIVGARSNPSKSKTEPKETVKEDTKSTEQTKKEKDLVELNDKDSIMADVQTEEMSEAEINAVAAKLEETYCD